LPFTVVWAGVVSVLFANGALFHVEQWGFFEGVQQVLSLEVRELARIYVLQEWEHVLSIFQLMQILPLNPDAALVRVSVTSLQPPGFKPVPE